MMDNLFKFDSDMPDVEKHTTFCLFISRVEDKDVDIEAVNDMISSFHMLEYNKCLGYKEKDFLEICNNADVGYDKDFFIQFRKSLTAFQRLSKTKEFKDKAIKGLKLNLEYYQEIKNIPAHKFKNALADLGVSNKKIKDNMIKWLLSSIHASMEFLKWKVPKELFQKVKESGVYPSKYYGEMNSD